MNKTVEHTTHAPTSKVDATKQWSGKGRARVASFDEACTTAVMATMMTAKRRICTTIAIQGSISPDLGLLLQALVIIAKVMLMNKIRHN